MSFFIFIFFFFSPNPIPTANQNLSTRLKYLSRHHRYGDHLISKGPAEKQGLNRDGKHFRGLCHDLNFRLHSTSLIQQALSGLSTGQIGQTGGKICSDKDFTQGVYYNLDIWHRNLVLVQAHHLPTSTVCEVSAR